jgi:hypothetical protein
VDVLGKNRTVPQVSLLRPGIPATCPGVQWTDPKWKPQLSPFSSRPGFPATLHWTRSRVRLSFKERRMRCVNATKFHRKIRGSEAEGSAVSLHPKPTFLRRFGSYERGFSTLLYVGWCGEGFEAVDVEVFIKIETEEIGCAAENEGALQKVAQALQYFVAN